MSRRFALPVGVAAVALVAVVTLSVVSQEGTVFPRTASPAGAQSYIISPLDGDVVGESFTVRFGLRGMGIAPAGIPMENTGHHHILVDLDELPPMTIPLRPTDNQVIHFGGGQTETVLSLPPGEHTLQLILGDASHVPHDPPVISKKITVTVKGPAAEANAGGGHGAAHGEASAH